MRKYFFRTAILMFVTIFFSCTSSKVFLDESGYSTDGFWLSEIGNKAEDIKKLERGSIIENSGSKILYKTKFLGLKGEANYFFKNGLLSKKEFKIVISNSDETKIKSKFDEMKRVIKTVEDYMDTKTEYVRGKIDTHEGKFGGSGLSGGIKVYNYKNIEYAMGFGFIVVGKFSVLTFSLETK